jgi:hypothetical protein
MLENLIINQDLKVIFDGWSSYKDGFLLSPDGKIFIGHFDDESSAGARQKVILNQKTIKKIVVIGSALGKDVSGIKDSGFSIYLDIKHTNGKYTYGINKAFDPKNNNLQEVTIEYIPESPVEYVNVYLMFRNHIGSVFFDKVSLYQEEISIIIPPSKLKVFFPGYIYPGSKWDQIIDHEDEFSHISIIANPHNGPGDATNDDYSRYIKKAQDVGVEVVGYVYTGYGKRSFSDVTRDIDTWYLFYPTIDGIFFDESSNKLSYVDHYHELCSYARSKASNVITQLNPGSSSIAEYDLVADTVFTFESFENTWLNIDVPKYIKNDPNPYNHAALVHTASQLEKSIEKAQQSNYGYIFITDDVHDDGNPWDSIPSFWSQEIELIRAYNKSLN